MRAVSVRQPWAWLAANGHIELLNFDWTTSYRGEFLIRAGLKLVKRDYRALATQLRDQLDIEVPDCDDEAQLPRGGIVGMALLTGTYVEHPSPLFRGPIGWTLSHAQPLPFTPFNPPHSGPDLHWFDVPRAAVGLSAIAAERMHS
ncbi:hypothetical protein [Roseateles asaccharophilus]|uniref:Uncharacterized protein n=1 Tax=Roseateles asaccharophilus TaxID=582607 RepID=A0ABU2A3G8_9BURK|nr:hypothetical protein [Roseateles asaccharophilus]MDR7331731.1 hypothetical protein [Roseateles asaccharophilus]